MRLAKFITLIILFVYSFSAFGQKKNIDQIACDNWPSIAEVNDGILVSNDGKHVVYGFESKSEGRVVCLYSLASQTTLRVKDASNPQITVDNRWFICISPQDGLLIKEISSKRRPEVIPNVSAFELGEDELSKDIFLIYRTGSGKTVVIRNLSTQTLFQRDHVDRYWFHSKKNLLVLEGNGRLAILNVKNKHQVDVETNDRIHHVIFGETGKNIAVFFENKADKWIELVNSQTGERKILIRQSRSIPNLELSYDPPQFVNKDKFILLKIQFPAPKKNGDSDSMITAGKLNIWSYKDHDIQPKQLANLKSKRPYLALTDCSTSKILFIENDTLSLRMGSISDKHAVLTSKVSNDEFYWNKDSVQLFLLNLENQSRRRITSKGYPGVTLICEDPSQNFLVWYDMQSRKYACYDIEKKILNEDICQGQLPHLYKAGRGEADKLSNRFTPYGIAGFEPGQPIIYLYSEFDIWRISLKGDKMPVCITNGYGELTKTKFRLFKEKTQFTRYGKGFLAWAFNVETMQNGFWKVSPKNKTNPSPLLMSDAAYYFEPTAPIVSANAGEDPTRFKPVKARDADVFFLRKMSYDAAPNFYMTSDFSTLTPLTKFDTEKQYNWLKSKLIKWKTPEGYSCGGILHVPENLDSNRKYPVIFNYYERRSECVNVYRTPELSGHNINIPWYVSNGYVVFELDFYYETGNVAKNITTIATSAVDKLRTLPFIDTSHMGIQGQSFGGYETCVLFTGTNLFAAACEMAGPTNIITEYGSIKTSGGLNLISADVGQRNIGQTPWDNPEKFIENSPIFHIRNVSTPVLMVHNRKDAAIDFTHAVEMYLGLRRIGKKVWLLEYDNEGHAIEDYNNKLDYTIRMQQFFDHYLKGFPAPFWMTKGIPASAKGVCNGLKLEESVITP